MALQDPNYRSRRLLVMNDWPSGNSCDFRLGSGAVHVWAISSNDQKAIDMGREILTDEENERAQRFFRDQDRHRYIMRRSALKFLLSKYAGIDPTSIRFAVNEFGKPTIENPGRFPRLEFSSSSSSDYALIAFSSEHPIGIDIEFMKRSVEIHSLAKRFFHPEEALEIKSQPESDQRRTFFNCWTRKEAYVKALGHGLYLPLNSFRVSVHDDDPKLEWTDESTNDKVRWKISCFTPHKKYVAALFHPVDSDFISRFDFNLNYS